MGSPLLLVTTSYKHKKKNDFSFVFCVTFRTFAHIKNKSTDK